MTLMDFLDLYPHFYGVYAEVLPVEYVRADTGEPSSRGYAVRFYLSAPRRLWLDDTPFATVTFSLRAWGQAAGGGPLRVSLTAPESWDHDELQLYAVLQIRHYRHVTRDLQIRNVASGLTLVESLPGNPARAPRRAGGAT